MSYDFDQELKGTLREHAQAVPIVPDLSGAAIRQARGIRRRRRVAGMAAAAAVLAVAVPVGLQAGDALSKGRTPPPPASQGPDGDGTDGTPDAGDLRSSLVTVRLTELPTGGAPTVPYLDGSQLIVDGEPVDLGVDGGSVSQIAYAGETAYFTTNDEGNLTLRSAPETIDPIPVASGPWASPDGRYVAYLADGEFAVIDTDGGEVSSVPVSGDYARSVSFVGDDVYFLAGNDDTLLRWRIGDAEAVPVDGIARATAVSSDGELVADMHKVNDLEASSCTRVKSLSGGDVLWETCAHRITGFSDDGSLALGASEYGDGIGDPYVVVLDADGDIVVKVEGPNNRKMPTFFQGGVFESATTVLTRVVQGDMAALVRCDLTTGECELVALTEGIDPFAGESPYRLMS